MKTPIRNKSLVLFLYATFSFGSNLTWLILDLLPQFARRLIFWLVFKHFGRDCMLDYRCFVRYPWRVSIGSNVVINRGCELYPSMQTDGGTITLEDHVVLGPGVVIFAAGHEYSQLDLPDISKPVTIGRYSWIGGKTIILPGVLIGEGVVVGAGSVVSNNIAAYSVAVGNPAKVIKKRILRKM